MKKEYWDPPSMYKTEDGKECEKKCSNPDGDENGMWCNEKDGGKKAYCKESANMLTQNQKKMKDCCPKEFPNCCEDYLLGNSCSAGNKSKAGSIDCTTVENSKFSAQTDQGLTCKNWDSIDISFDCPEGWEQFSDNGKDDGFLYCRREESPSDVCALGNALGGAWGTAEAWGVLKEGDPAPECRYPVYSPNTWNPRDVRRKGLGKNFCRNPGDTTPDGKPSTGMWCYSGSTWNYCATKFFFKTNGKPSSEDGGPATERACKERAGPEIMYKKGSWKKVPVNSSVDDKTLILHGEYPEFRGLEKLTETIQARIANTEVRDGKTYIEFDTKLGPCKSFRTMRYTKSTAE